MLKFANLVGINYSQEDDAMGKSTLKIAFLIFVAVVMCACSSSGIITIKQPLAEKIRPGKTVSLSVDIDTEEHKKAEDFQEVATRIRDRLFAKLPSEGIFKYVVLAPEPADYRMDVLITNARMVSGAARMWGGVMAGHSDAQMSVKVYNLENNQMITYLEVDGTSASHPMSSESTPDDAIREAVNQIVKGLRQ
jgi:hypothetical protein